MSAIRTVYTVNRTRKYIYPGDTGAGVYQRCWLAHPLMTNQDMLYIFPINSFQMARSSRLSVFLCFAQFCFIGFMNVCCDFFFFAVKMYFGKLLILSLPLPKINQSNCVLISGWKRSVLGRGEVPIWLRCFAIYCNDLTDSLQFGGWSSFASAIRKDAEWKWFW